MGERNDTALGSKLQVRGHPVGLRMSSQCYSNKCCLSVDENERICAMQNPKPAAKEGNQRARMKSNREPPKSDCCSRTWGWEEG
eukprot:1441133-Amphidinium_carterae.1